MTAEDDFQRAQIAAYLQKAGINPTDIQQAKPYKPSHDSMVFPSYFLSEDIARKMNPGAFDNGFPSAAVQLFGYKKKDGTRNKTATEVLFSEYFK